jgi:hypothetical protein
MVKGNDQSAAILMQDTFQPNHLAEIPQAFSPVKRYNTR